MIRVAFAVLMIPAVAAAGTFDDPPIGEAQLPFDGEAHVNGGYELLSGNTMTSVFRAHVLLGGHSSHGDLRPSVAVGATFADGWLYGDKMIPNSTWKGVGPELEGGIYHDGLRVYGSFAMVDSFRPQVQSSWGERVALGVNFAIAEVHWASGTDGLYGKDSTDVARPLVFFFPQQLEAVYEHDDLGDRAGFAVSWGL